MFIKLIILISLIDMKNNMKITACPLCGSTHVGTAGIRDGVNPQEFSKQACKNCGWTGMPLEFDTIEEYQHFLDDLGKKDTSFNKNYFEDPAEAAPIRRYILRSFLTSMLILCAVVLPGIVYGLVSIVGPFSNEIGALCALLSFIFYLYLVWKKELWNTIKR
jgi:hypothetical protein